MQSNKPGHYRGADGREYRWEKSACGYFQRVLTGQSWGLCAHIAPEDVDAAKSALDALIEEEAGEWVEWSVDEFSYRSRREGDLQWRRALEGWTTANEFEQAAYRTGRQTGREDERARWRELGNPRYSFRDRNVITVSYDWYERVRALMEADHE